MVNENDDALFTEELNVDMSSEAILNRLDLAAQLLELCLFLGQAKLIGPVNPANTEVSAAR